MDTPQATENQIPEAATAQDDLPPPAPEPPADEIAADPPASAKGGSASGGKPVAELPRLPGLKSWWPTGC